MVPERTPIDGRTPTAISPSAVEARFLTRVYGWMFAGLLATALVAAYTVTNESLLKAVINFRMVLFIGQLGLVAWLSGLVGKMSATTASVVFMVYSVLTGLTFSLIFLVYTQGSIWSTFLVSSVTFGAMSVYGLVTKRSLDGVGSFCFMGLIGVVVASLVNIFLKSTMLEFVVSCVGVIVFVGLTAYDTRRLKIMAAQVDADSEEGRKGAVVGALALYLDFINLFLMLLRLFGRRR